MKSLNVVDISSYPRFQCMGAYHIREKIRSDSLQIFEDLKGLLPPIFIERNIDKIKHTEAYLKTHREILRSFEKDGGDRYWNCSVCSCRIQGAGGSGWTHVWFFDPIHKETHGLFYRIHHWTCRDLLVEKTREYEKEIINSWEKIQHAKIKFQKVQQKVRRLPPEV